MALLAGMPGEGLRAILGLWARLASCVRAGSIAAGPGGGVGPVPAGVAGISATMPDGEVLESVMGIPLEL